MGEDESQGQDQGEIGEYGVLIVPPAGEAGSWLVTLAAWDDDLEGYSSGTMGPLLETREEALEAAQRVLDWLKTQGQEGDLVRVWEQMQEQIGAEALEQEWPPRRDPWGRLIP